MQLVTLKRKIEALGRRPGFVRGRWKAGTGHWQLGVPDVDDALPAGGLAMNGLHEVAGRTPADSVAASGFLFALIARLPEKGKSGKGPVLWCQSPRSVREYGGLYGAGLSPFGLAPGRLLTVRTARERDIPWCLEEGVRIGRLAVVAGEGAALSFTATRRLSLATVEAATPCLYLDLAGSSGSSTAVTRWRVSAAGQADREDPRGPGAHGWQVSLTRARGGRPGAWHLVWNYETHSFDLAAPLRDGEVRHRIAPGGKPAALQRAG